MGCACTLVELNDQALEVARAVFNKHSCDPSSYTFICSSLYEIDLDRLAGTFDISHSRGVFMHVSNKSLSFKILCSLAKPGGYIIYGDRNAAGGIQEMLQRFAIFNLGGTSESEIVKIAEALFSDDIDRSQQSVPRTREAIIYDRWVIQQQDDPSVSEVLAMFAEHGVSYISSWPKIEYAGRGLSTHTDPNDGNSLSIGSAIAESLWMLMQCGEDEKVNLQAFSNFDGFTRQLANTAAVLRNLQLNKQPCYDDIKYHISRLRDEAETAISGKSPFLIRAIVFLTEVVDFLDRVNRQDDLSSLRNAIDGYKHLFKGFSGVRHIDYIGYKHK